MSLFFTKIFQKVFRSLCVGFLWPTLILPGTQPALLLTLQLTPHGSIYDSSLAAAQNRPIVSPKNVSFLTFFEGKQRQRKRWDGGMSNGDIFESSHVIYAPFVGRTLWQWSLLIRLMVLKIPFDPLWNKCNDEWEMNIRDPCSTCSTLQRGLCCLVGGWEGGV